MSSNQPPSRRHFLRLAISVSTGALLTACGGGSGAGGGETSSVPIVDVPLPTPTSTTPPTGQGSHPLNLALNLAYLGAQYYGIAARGSGLSTSLISGIGTPGAATGARQGTFSDPMVAGLVTEFADDKLSQVVALRKQIGALAAAQPALDLSSGSTGAFAGAAQGAGIVAAGSAFDPYASDDNFLLGAFLIENSVAAAYRSLLIAGGDDATVTMLSAQLGEAIYHGGLIRTLLDARASTNVSIGDALTNATTMFAMLDGSNVGDQTLATAAGASSNILDADGRPIPFTRANAQILKALYLSSSGIGGFLPAGANGVAA